MISSHFILISTLFLTALALNSPSPYSRFFGNSNQGYLQVETMDELTTLKITATFPRESWMGFGFGTSMLKAELVMMIAAGDEAYTRVISTHATAHQKPPIPPVQSPSYRTTWQYLNETHIQFVILRAFDTGVQGEAILTTNVDIPMVFAMRIGNLTNDTSIAFHKDGFGYWGIHIRGDGTVLENGYDFYKLHGFLMWAAWGLLGLVQLATNRYLKMYWRFVMWVHRISGSLILLITFVMAFMALSEADWQVHVGIHQIIGVMVLTLVSLIVAGGIMNRSMLQRLRWRTADLLRVKRAHRYFGYFMLALTEISIVTGSLKYADQQGEAVNVPGLVHFILFIILIIIVEGMFQRFKRGDTQYKDTNDVMTVEAFEKRIEGGEELVLLDDLVLDVSKFKSEHPGGKFILEHNIGRDISKYFYGGYILENTTGLKPVRHSNLATNIVNGLIIGRLVEKASTFSARISADQVINHFSKAFILRVEGVQPGLQPYASTDLEGFGKHYLLRSYHNVKIRRHYTVANCMKKEAYDQYLGLIRQFRDGNNNYQFNKAILPENHTELEVVFVCKNYNVVTGLSQRLHTAKHELIQVKAIMGKGLGIKEEGGTHIGFVGGTGVLIFVDFLALMLRANLGLVEQDELHKIFREKSTFKLVLYVSFDNRKDAIALELLEGLYEVTQKKNIKNFELVIRVSQEKAGSRWDEAYIKRQLDIRKNETISKIWVCGPPIMNEYFDRAFESLRNSGQTKLKRSQIEIM